MKSAMMRIVSRLLIMSMLALPFQAAQAGMIGTEQAASSNVSAQMERSGLVRVIDRPEVANQLQALGLDASAAKARVAAMTDSEVHTLASNINAAPAGGHTSGWAVAVVIALGIWAYYAWK